MNTELLYIYYNDKYNKLYDTEKVKLCYEVYYRLCLYYGYNCTVEPFLTMVGIDYDTLQEWLSSGRSNLLMLMLKNAKNSTVARFENSPVPILRLASANYKYNLEKPVNDRQEAAAVDVLPDLLTISGTKEKALTDSEN